jgi:hypothetical protein
LRIVGEIGLAQHDVGDRVALHRDRRRRHGSGDDKQADRGEFRDSRFKQKKAPRL